MGFAHSAKVAEIDPASWSDRTLSNGLRVLLIADRSTTSAAVTVGYHVGGKDDPQGRSGFAHLFEHLMFKGTQHTSAETIDRLTEDIGGYNNAYTTPDTTVYYEVVPGNYLETMLWAEADRLSSLIVDDANFATEREVVIGEYDQRVLADSYGMLDEYIDRRLFPDHPYGQGVIGDPDSLRAASLEDVKAFHVRHYRPDNAVLAVVGDLDLDETNAWVDKYFAPIEKPASPIVRVQAPKTGPILERVRKYRPNVAMPAITLSFRTPGRSAEDAAYLRMLEMVLGAGRSSRLHRSLVYETRLAARADADAEFRELAGLFQFRALLHVEANLEQAEAILNREIERLCEEPVSAAELDRVCNQLESGIVRHHETANDRSTRLVADTLIRGNPLAVALDAKAYAEATPDDLLRVARTVFTKQPSILEYLSTDSADATDSTDPNTASAA